MKAEAASNAPIATARPTLWAIVKDPTLGFECLLIARASYSNTSRGGKSRIGCMDRYAAKAKASMKVVEAP
jgi:hypothetical protein